MTREEAIKSVRSFCYEDRIDRFIDRIYDDFESREKKLLDRIEELEDSIVIFEGISKQ